MKRVDTELVNKITEQVIEALGRQGDATQPETTGPTDPDVHRDPSALETRSVSKVFITVDDLTQRLTGSKGGVIELAHNEFLTPAAVDLAEAKNLTISKIELNSELPAFAKASEDKPEERKKDSNQTPDTTTIGLVIDRTNEKVRSVTGSLSHDGIGFSRFDGSSCWMENVRSMCQSVASGELPAGVVVMPYAADAMVLANKIKSIRAVQGTRLGSVQAGLRHFGANVLILEHAFSTFHEMCTIIRAFTNGRGNQATSGLLLEAVGREERS
jgi:ribose 5-phosphate isomerase RpiB